MTGFWTVILGFGGLVFLFTLTLSGIALVLRGLRQEKEQPDRKARYAVMRILGFFLLVPALGLLIIVVSFFIGRAL